MITNTNGKHLVDYLLKGHAFTNKDKDTIDTHLYLHVQFYK